MTSLCDAASGDAMPTKTLLLDHILVYFEDRPPVILERLAKLLHAAGSGLRLLLFILLHVLDILVVGVAQTARNNVL